MAKKDQIKAQLDEAGIEYDARLGADKLAALLPKSAEEMDAEPVVTPGPRKTVTMRVEKNFWPGDEAIAAGWPKTDRRRVLKGTLVDLTPEAAMDALEAGIASRVK